MSSQYRLPWNTKVVGSFTPWVSSCGHWLYLGTLLKGGDLAGVHEVSKDAVLPLRWVWQD